MTSDRHPADRRRLVLLAAVLGGLTTTLVVLLVGGGAPRPSPAGLPDPGPFTGWGLPATALAGRLLGIAVVGSLLVPVLVRSDREGELHGRAFAATRRVGTLAGAWAVVAVVQLVLTWSDQFAVPVVGLAPGDVWGFALQVDQGRALLAQAGLALVVALGGRWALRVREAVVLLALALAALVPPVLTGHSAASGSHDTAVVSLLLHVLAAALWCGGLAALWWHLGSRPQQRRLALRRFSSLAAWCVGVVAVSGVVNALVRTGSVEALATTTYGRLASVKILLLLLLLLVAARVRRGVVAAHDTADRSAATLLAGLTAVELTVMAVAVGLGVGLSRTLLPVGEPYTSAAESLLGGPVPPAPDPGRLLLSFTPSGIGLAVTLLGVAAYAAGVVALRRRGERWSVARSVAWIGGLVLAGYATMGGLGTYSHVMFSAHMGSHMVLSMLAPLLLVLGAPVTLALRALPGSDVPGVPGPRQWLAAALRSAPARLLSRPVVVGVLFAASLYVVYLTPLFGALMESHLGHAAMEVHFLLVGYLFFEVVLGDAPVPRRLPHLGRLALVLLVMPFHAFFALTVMSSTEVIGGDYYRLLDRGYAEDLLADQYLGGSLTWALGEVPLVLVVVVLLLQWHRSDQRDADRHDRQSARDGDAELHAYNAMLAGLAQRDAPATGPVHHPTTSREDSR